MTSIDEIAHAIDVTTGKQGSGKNIHLTNPIENVMRYLTSLLLLFPMFVMGQIKNDFITSANLSLKSRKILDEKNSEFQITLGSRTGKFFQSSWALGASWSLTYRHTKVFRSSSVQTGPNSFFEKGGGSGVYGSAGVFGDKYFQLRPDLYLSLNNDLLYFWGQFIEKTVVVDQNGVDVGVSVESYEYNPKRIQYSFWPNLTYFLTKRHAITASIGNFNMSLVGKNPTTNQFLSDGKSFDINVDFPSVTLGYSMVF